MPDARALAATHARAAIRRAVREELAELRRRILDQDFASNLLDAAGFAPQRFFSAVLSRLERQNRHALRPAINATGIIIHTNLGRAPLADVALRALAEIGGGYSTLEFDFASGGRGSRYRAVEELLCEVTGAEAGLVANNNAAAVLLALTALAAPGEVVISRGELVEIGGSFRLPDIIMQSGARLVEVGTTNKTRLADYEDAVTAETRVLLKVHQSNFHIVGFTEATPVAALSQLAKARGLTLIEDLGSGSLFDLRQIGLPGERTVMDSLRSGADLVTFSGDKLLGGPQAGLIVGRRDLIARLRRHPLLRALRIDKLSLAALEATLRLYRDGDALLKVPVIRMLAQTEAELNRRAGRLRRRLAMLPELDLRIERGTTYAGGGALPGVSLPTRLVSIGARDIGVESLAAKLRDSRPPVIGRIAQNRLLLDMRTLADHELAAVAAAFRGALA